MDFAAMFIKLITKNGLVAAFIIIGITTWIAYKIGGLTKGRIHGSAIAIFFGLILAYIGGGGAVSFIKITRPPDPPLCVSRGGGHF